MTQKDLAKISDVFQTVFRLYHPPCIFLSLLEEPGKTDEAWNVPDMGIVMWRWRHMPDKGISRSDLRERKKEENNLILKFGRWRSIRSISRKSFKTVLAWMGVAASLKTGVSTWSSLVLQTW